MDAILKYLSDFMKINLGGVCLPPTHASALKNPQKCRSTELLPDLYITEIGYFPVSAGHWVDRPQGCDTNIMIFLGSWIRLFFALRRAENPGTSGRVDFHSRRLPPPLRGLGGYSLANPLIHFSGQRSADYLARLNGELFGEVLPEETEQIVAAFEQTQEVLSEVYTDSGLLLFSAKLSRLLALALQCKQAHGKKSRLTNLRILESMQWIREHLAQPQSLPEIARRAGLSVPHFSTLFKKQSGLSPMRYLVHARMTRVCGLLDSTDKSVSEISREVGFNDAFHFTKTIHTVVGSSPSAYRLDSVAQHENRSGHRDTRADRRRSRISG